jgi:hypothetical protein
MYLLASVEYSGFILTRMGLIALVSRNHGEKR